MMNLKKAIKDALLRNATRCIEGGNYEKGFRYLEISQHFASREERDYLAGKLHELVVKYK